MTLAGDAAMLEPSGGRAAGADYCAVSTATRLLGDRWSLLVVRELFVGNSRFSEIHEALPGLSRSLLVARLGYLSRLGIIERRPPDGRDLRAKHFYVLTGSGRALGPVLDALGSWASRWTAPARPLVDGETVMDLEQLCESFDPTVLPTERIQIQFLLADSSPVWLRADRSGARACRGVGERQPNLVVRTTLATLDSLYWGGRMCRDAIACRDISFEGPAAYAELFGSWFPNRPAVRGTDHRGQLTDTVQV